MLSNLLAVVTAASNCGVIVGVTLRKRYKFIRYVALMSETNAS